ncbi:hypothetical protein D3C75_1127140 [compost metagenome]
MAPDTRVLVSTLTLGNCWVSSSAVAVSRTRSICRVLKLPMTWPALARLPIRASISLRVWVYAVTWIPAPPPLLISGMNSSPINSLNSSACRLIGSLLALLPAVGKPWSMPCL